MPNEKIALSYQTLDDALATTYVEDLDELPAKVDAVINERWGIPRLCSTTGGEKICINRPETCINCSPDKCVPNQRLADEAFKQGDFNDR